MSDLFVSYAREDRDFVDRLSSELAARGKESWIDWKDIPPTADWMERVFDGIRGASAFVFVLSADSLNSEVCRNSELKYAAELNKRIIPLLHKDVDGCDVPESLARPNWIDARSDEGFGEMVATLIEALDTDLEHVAMHTRWLLDAARWEKQNRDGSLLLRGAALVTAEDWLGRAAERGLEPQPTALHYEFILAGRRSHSHRQRVVIAAVSAALVITAVLAVVAVTQRNQARAERRTAQSRELAASALLNLTTDPELSLLLAKRAAEVQPTYQAADALRRALLASRVRVALRAGSYVGTVAVARSGRQGATGSDDGIVRLWSLSDGGRERVLGGHKGLVDAVRYSPDGKMVASSARDGTARVWASSTGRPIVHLRYGPNIGPTRATEIAWSPDGRDLAVWRPGGRAKVWRRGGGASLSAVRGPVHVNAIAFGGRGRMAIAAKKHSAVVSGRAERALSALEGVEGRSVAHVAFDRSGRRILGVTHDGFAIVWDRRGHLLRSIRVRFARHTVAFSRDGRLLATGDDKMVRLWNLAARRGASQLALAGHGKTVTAVAFSPDGEVLASASDDGSVRLWNPRSGSLIAVLRGHAAPVVALTFTADSGRIITGSEDATARVWAAGAEDFPSGPVLRRSTIDHAAISEDGSAAVIETTQKGRRLGEALRLPDLRRRGRWPGLVSVVALDDRASTALTASGNMRSVVTGQVVARVRPAEHARLSGQILAAAFDRSGRRVATGGAATPGAAASDASIRIWDARDGRLLMQLPGHGVGRVPRRINDLHFDATADRLISSADDGRVRFWDLDAGRQIRALRVAEPGPSSNGLAAALKSDGRSLLTTTLGLSTGVSVWDLTSGRRTAELASPPESVVTDARFSPDGQLIVTAGADGSMRVWDATSREPLATLHPDRRRRRAVLRTTFSAAGSQLTAVGEAVIRSYVCDVCAPLPRLIERAAQRVTRSLSPAERLKYLHREP